ncbi:GW dipeptide domain-containing protein [Levilactobacillus yiduensis]|uniref:GW dipeptide domain-containing protein n=1 Tax=Levilactobacillus yiduensis TaxID=2953880 RepID=UPI000EF3520F|nr:GW dipeptide domain-containing protein [Levilactobacillus yiduensis]AYM03497.1 hypothetical protein D8911_11080 [Levilactobacillus brevis]
MKKRTIIILATLGIIVGGCANSTSQRNEVSASSSRGSSENKKYLTKSSSEVKFPVGKIVSREKMNVDDAYKVTNKKAIFYRSLKEFGKKSGFYSDYQTVHGSNLTIGATEKIVTTKGTYYHMGTYISGGFENDVTPKTESKAYENQGYIQASYVTPFQPVTRIWTYSQRRPYYLAYPCNHRIWTKPAYTVHYTYISHTFDRLSHQQLYATKELIKHNGSHYVYLEAKNHKLGWVYKSPKVLVRGRFVDPGTKLLKRKQGETKLTHVQSLKSTKNRVGVNDSLSMPQRAYVIEGKNHQVRRVLVMGMDNRPTKLSFKKGRVTKLISYTYRRKVWRVVKNQKKLRHSYLAHHTYIDTPATKTSFYNHNSRKLFKNKTIGADGSATTIVYRNGKVKFATHPYKDIITYPYANFK